MVAALNAEQMGENTKCGSTAAITGPKGSVTVVFVDKCPGCNKGDVDLSPAAFNKIADPDQGRVPVTWEFVQ